jgi:HEAT repeat protein
VKRLWPALLVVSACDGGSGTPPPVTLLAARTTYGDVVARNLARLDAELAGETVQPEAIAPDLEPHVLGLLETVAHARDALRGIAAEELAGLGGAAVPVLARELTDRGRDLETRRAAAEALADVGTPESLEVLLASLEGARTAVERDNDLYRVCAGAVGRSDAAWLAPRLSLCLKYEIDHLTVVHLSDSLARLGLVSGLAALFVVVRASPDADPREGRLEPQLEPQALERPQAPARSQAEIVLERLRVELGCADWNELARLWNDGVLERLPPPPSGPRYEREVWRTVARLGEWQLRGVDDARFTLLQQRETAAAILGQALSDADVYVRLHSAQCLARMGPRGRVAESALIAALDDPQVGATAAEALGRLGGPAAARALAERLAPERGLELRTACARALGALAPEDLESVLAPWLGDDAPLDLSTAAAEALLRSGRARPGSTVEDAAVRRAAAGLTSGRVEPSTCEAALNAWLATRPEPAELLAQWRALGERPVPERLAARAAWIETWRASAQSR